LFALGLIGPALAIPALLTSPFDPLPPGGIAMLCWCLLILSSHLGSLWLRRSLLGQRISWREWFRESLAGLLLLHPATLVAGTCLLLGTRHPGTLGVWLLVAASLILVWICCGQVWRLLHALGLVSPLRTAIPLGNLPPGVRVFELELAAANAWALPNARVVLMSKRLLDLLDPLESVAILQHELGHLAEAGRVRALRAVAALPYLAFVWVRPLIGQIGMAGGLLVLLLAWGVARLVERYSKSWEEQADAHARDHIEDPKIYAHALEKIHACDLIPAVTSKARTHPHHYDRMLSAGVQPDYPRPAATHSRTGWGLGLGLVLGFWLGGLDQWTRPSHVPPTRQAVLRALAFGGYADEHLDTLADLREERGDDVSAAKFRAAAEELRASQDQAGAGSQR